MLFTPWLSQLTKGWRPFRRLRRGSGDTDGAGRRRDPVAVQNGRLAPTIERLEERSLLASVGVLGSGYARDVIEIDLPDVPDFNSQAAARAEDTLKGRLLLESNFCGSERMYFVPSLAADAPGDVDLLQRGFQGDFVGRYTVGGETRTFTVSIFPEGRSLPVDDNRILGDGRADELDILRIQQRLAYLNFPSQDGDPLDVNLSATDQFNTDDRHAIGLFNAIVGPNHQHSVSSSFTAAALPWINSTLAPSWVELRDNNDLTLGFSIQGDLN